MRARLGHAAASAAILAYFTYFAWASLGSHFAPDEMMNMGWAWDAGLASILTHIVKFWERFYRPTGALYYWTFHRLFHLNPDPFRYFDFAVLLFNLWLTYRLARALQAPRAVAYLAVFLFSYHERIMIWVAYNGAWTYDRLCFTFTVSALLLYIRNYRLAVPALFLLALGAKEMAVVLPGLLVAYHAAYYFERKKPDRATIAFLLLLTFMALLYAYGRTHGEEALANKDQYRLKAITVGNYLQAQGKHLQDYLFLEQPASAAQAGALLALLAALAALLRSPLLLFAMAFILITPVPIAFVDRGGGALYLPLAGWCLYAAGALHQLTQRLPQARPAAFALGAAALAYWLTTHNLAYWVHEKPAMLRNGDVVWRTIGELHQLRPPIRPGAKILIDRSRFEGWDMWFILALWADVKPFDAILTGKNAPQGAATPGLTGVLSLDEAGRLTYKPLN